MNWSDIKSAGRVRLSDPNSKIWSDTQLLYYANDTIDEIAIEGEGHIKHYQLALTDSQRTYSLPADLYELRGVRINGLKCFGTTQHNVEELDLQYLTATGQPEWYYLEDPQTIAFYRIPSWTDSYTAFDSEYGVVTSIDDDGDYYSADAEVGVVLDIIDDSMSSKYVVEPIYGEVIGYNDAPYTAVISYAYRPAYLSNDSDTPDMPTYMHYAVLYGMLAKAFAQEGHGQDPESALFYQKRFEELIKEFYRRNREFARGQDQMLSSRPPSWGSDMDWRMRVKP